MPVKTIATDKDAYVDAGSPDTNFGGSLTLLVRFQGSLLGGNDREALVGFDLSTILDDSDVIDILAATLRIPPQSADDGESLDAYQILPDEWTETNVTWNNKPGTSTQQDTEASGDDPHEWDVLEAVNDAFTDDTVNRVGFLIQMQGGLSGEEYAAEYDSREANGQAPLVELETREQRRSDLDSQITASQSGTGDLDSFVEVKFFHDRWLGGRQTSLTDADSNAYSIGDIAWDPSLDQFWTAEVFAGASVHRHNADGTHDGSFEVHEDGSQLSQDVQSVAVDDAGNVFVGLDSGSFDTDGDVVECTVDDTNQVLDVQTRNSSHDVSPNWLTFDGTRVWLLEFASGNVEERHPSNWALNRSGSIGNADSYRGIARDESQGDLVLFKDAGGEIEVQDPDNLGTVTDSFDREDIVTTGEGLALRGRSWYGRLFVGEGGDSGSDVWTFAPREIQSQLLVPNPQTVDLSSQVQPGSIPATADLDSQVATGNDQDLSSQTTPRVSRSTDLDSTVQPAGLEGSTDLTSVVEVTAVPITDDHLAQAIGRVAPTLDVDEDDMADVSGEVGSAVTVDPDGTSRDLRRVVHLLDSEESYPKARSDPATTLHRGDAVLYAQAGDELAVGDTLQWQDKRWRVVGLLGWEMVGDSQLYQEIGLRRQATVHEAKATGTVQREDNADLYSEVEVPDTA